MTSISAFGKTGPYREYKADDLIEQAIGRLVHISQGYPDKEPLKTAGHQSEYTAGILGCIGTLSALYGRDTGGVGQHLDISIMEAVVSIQLYPTTALQLLGKIIQFAREQECVSVVPAHPMTIYPCKKRPDWRDHPHPSSMAHLL